MAMSFLKLRNSLVLRSAARIGVSSRAFSKLSEGTDITSAVSSKFSKSRIDKFKAKGIDSVICVSVNDPYTINELNAKDAIEFYGDFDGKFHKSLGLNKDLSAALLGPRSVRNIQSRHCQSKVQVRFLHQSSVSRDPKAKPKKYKYPLVYDPYGPRPQPSNKIVELAERIAALSPEERKQIGPALNEHLRLPKQQMISTDGMSLGAKQDCGTEKAEEKKEKTTFDVKLEKFDAAAKIKVIKEVRTFTSLGLKEAKELVEKVPAVLKQGVTKEEANEIIAKIKAVGGVAVME